MTAARTSARTIAAGLGLGIVSLAVVGGFAIGLPKIVDDHASAVSLPDELPGGLRAVELIAKETAAAADDAQAQQAQEFLDKQQAIKDSAAKAIEKLYDAPATLRAYATTDNKAQLTVTVVSQEAGPFLPQGPVPDPASYGYVRGAYTLEQVGDGVCSEAWSAPVPEGQKIDASQLPSSVYCQVAGEGITYLAIGSGLTAQDAVAALDAVAGD